MDGYGNGYNNMNGYNNGGGYSNPTPPPAYGNHPKFATMLTLSILMTCCCNTIPGVVAIVLTCLANSAYKQGMVTDADSKMRGASIALIVGIALFALIMIVYLIMMAMGLVTAFSFD
ncbi:MAG: CD225/dispanin family protein [Lachnospiraceae bacterium]|nr:CD225/dispanin family protein [Lachnospiraceae bacterium]